MICSAAELGIGEDAAGIMVLDPDLKIGSDFSENLPFPDVVFDISITPNRPDAMSIVGLAREIAAYYSGEMRLPPHTVATEQESSRVRVEIEDEKGCPRYVGREVADVEIRESPLWMQLRLRSADVRPINNVVDITNYVMLELGQPLHAFDLDQVGGERIVVRRARDGETLQTLDGVERRLDVMDLMICDGNGVVAFAGIMGGEESEVTEATTRVLIEAANFHPPSVMFSSKRHNLRTEASSRFERGVDPNLPGVAAERAARLMVELAGGKALADVADVYPQEIVPWTIDLPLSEVERILGISIESTVVIGLLRRLRMDVSGEDPLRVTVPTNRPDLLRPIDLIEEIARLYGYDRFPETLPAGPAGGLSDAQVRDRVLREVLINAGIAEAQTMSFVGRQELDALGLPDDDPRRGGIRVRNPLREEEAYLRTTLLPNLLKAVRYNVSHGLADVCLFEVGKVFLARPAVDDPRIPDQPEHLAYVMAGGTGAQGIHAARRPVDVYTATGVWDLLVLRLGLMGTALRQATIQGLHPGRAAEVMVGARVIGFVGELHPAVARRFDLAGRVAVAEVAVDPLVGDRGWWQFQEPSTFPRVEFDLAFELEIGVAASDVISTVRSAGGSRLEDISVFDEFTGPPLAAGRKSLALHLVFRAPDQTLTNEAVAPTRSAIIAAVEEATGGRLRGG
jgi:phenylalanyl-tRNA synthetase beta chain